MGKDPCSVPLFPSLLTCRPGFRVLGFRVYRSGFRGLEFIVQGLGA